MAKTQKDVLKRILKQLKSYKFHIALTVLFALFSVAGTLTVPVLFGRIVNAIVGAGQVDFEAIKLNIIIILACIAVTAISQWLMSIINNFVTYNVVKDIREEAFLKIQSLPLKFIDAHPYGDIVSRNISDVDQFADGLLMGFTQLFSGVLTILGTLVLMLVINWVIALVVVILTPISMFVAKFIATRTYSMFKKTSELRGKQTAFIDEMVGNLKVVQAFNRQNANIKSFDEINEKLTNASLKSIFYSSLTNPATRFVNAIVYAMVALSGALMLVFETPLPFEFSVGMLTSLLAYANQYTKPFNEISSVITELQNAIACAGRIYELIDEDPQTADGTTKLDKIEGNTRFKKVTFSYSEDTKLIENFELEVKKGQRIAIVGPTGCGKTTLINLLMRFYDPVSGVIEVDGIDTKTVTRHSLRKNYGMVLQDTWLRSGTIRDNIAMGKPDATDDEILKAAKDSHAYNFISQLPNGLNTVIGEDGGNLSQGQKQLLCIARIMLCLPPMLILDEATSSIDTRTEIKIQEAFAKMMKGRTCFIVAHRLTTIKESDVILVMNDGNVVEKGTHAELLKKGGFYSKFYNSQFAV